MVYHYEPSHHCEVCQKSFHLKTDLKRHRRTHLGEKPYECSTCNKRFALISTLKNHLATHSDEIKFKCNICPDDRSFKTKVGLTNHMRYHYEPKHSCVHCNKKYYTLTHLKQHIKSHLEQTSSSF